MTLIPLLLFFAAPPEPETAASIMARVAENQDRAEQSRSAFVYRQNALVRVNHSNGKLAHEVYSEYTVIPAEKGVKKVRTVFQGKYVDRGKVVEYSEPDKARHEHMTVEMDGEICTDLAKDLADDKRTKDGIARDMFPLTAAEQKYYTFKLDGTEEYRGTPVYRILFQPLNPEGQRPWAGEALIDRNEFQPVLITTHLALKIPLVVRTVLGTNIEHLGFKVAYKKFDEGLWFPVTYGGEFKLRLLFFYARRVGVSVQNSGFQRADVSSKVTFGSIE